MDQRLIITIVVLGVLAYLAGSIPFGLLTGLARGVDIRRHGSCNIGATNAGRILGKRYFYLVLILDSLKGWLPTAAAGHVLASDGLMDGHFALASGLWLLVGFAALAGHNWPLYLKFKGGKGVATSLGVVLAVYPYYTYPGLVALGVWIAVVAITRYVSLGSILAAIAFIYSYGLLIWYLEGWEMHDQWPLFSFAGAMAIVLVWRHRANILRLKAGLENKF